MCGFISIFGRDGTDVLQDALSGLLAIQHRGQDAAGLVSFDKKFEVKKGLGLVREVFEDKHMTRLSGPVAVAHVRYPTVGSGGSVDVQPFTIDFPIGITIAHNGNIANFQELKRTYFQERNIHLHSDCDLEAVLYVFADALLRSRENGAVTAASVQTAVKEVFEVVKGAYSVVGFIAGGGMFAFRDPFGIKPAILGTKKSSEGTTYAVASESVVLDVAGYENLRDLKAGELLWIDQSRTPQFFSVSNKPHRPCVFEYMYFARPDSTLDGVSVYQARLESGKRLAHAWRKTGLEIDAVIPVPESARTAAQSMAEVLDVPYREGFVKNRYVGRTFIMANDELRKESVRDKLNPIRVEFEGKRVLIVDDSVVRGHTSRQLAKIARQMGASKVYLASYSPPLVHPCLYGIDMSTKRDFVALSKSSEEIAAELGCDFLLYQTTEDMVDAVNSASAQPLEFCKACFEGIYPTGDITPQMLHDIEVDRTTAASSVS